MTMDIRYKRKKSANQYIYFEKNQKHEDKPENTPLYLTNSMLIHQRRYPRVLISEYHQVFISKSNKKLEDN
jgi:hypothetical protein